MPGRDMTQRVLGLLAHGGRRGTVDVSHAVSSVRIAPAEDGTYVVTSAIGIFSSEVDDRSGSSFPSLGISDASLPPPRRGACRNGSATSGCEIACRPVLSARVTSGSRGPREPLVARAEEGTRRELRRTRFLESLRKPRYDKESPGGRPSRAPRSGRPGHPRSRRCSGLPRRRGFAADLRLPARGRAWSGVELAEKHGYPSRWGWGARARPSSPAGRSLWLDVLVDVEQVVRVVFTLDLPQALVVAPVRRLHSLLAFFHHEVDVRAAHRVGV
jgi:hypothetical protein